MPHGARLSRPEVPGDHHHGMDSPLPDGTVRHDFSTLRAEPAWLGRQTMRMAVAPTSFPRVTGPTPQLSAFSILKIPISR